MELIAALNFRSDCTLSVAPPGKAGGAGSIQSNSPMKLQPSNPEP
jgi:hypothetical protein